MTDLDQQFETIYTDEADALSGIAIHASAGDHDLAADITQETWLRALLTASSRMTSIQESERAHVAPIAIGPQIPKSDSSQPTSRSTSWL